MLRRAALAIGLALAPLPVQAAPDRAFVVLGENGVAVARAITAADHCPALTVDGKPFAMNVRAPAGTPPERPTSLAAEFSKPVMFPVTTCDAMLPAGTRTASIGGKRLPAVARTINRIVVIGDTGCRLKAADKAWQACNDPAAYPFARVAARAAAWHPQLVIHVGDYHYRETPCPNGMAGCTGSPWGYGWDVWDADLFAPGAPLFAAAPWVVVRGNHENCPRAGQGWWRFVDPRPLLPGRDCDRAADDATGDAATVYAVPIGGGARVVVADLATAPDKVIEPTDPRFAAYAAAYDAIAALTDGGGFNMLATHKPILGVSATEKDGETAIRTVTIGTRSVFATKSPDLLPPGVDMILSGHVHLWEQVSFARRYPPQFIAGFSGTQEDVLPLPSKLPPGTSPAPGEPVAAFSAWTKGFGFMTLERKGARRWTATVHDVSGAVINRCQIDGRISKCDS